MSANEIKLECQVNIDDIIAWNYYSVQNSTQWKKPINSKNSNQIGLVLSIILFIISFVTGLFGHYRWGWVGVALSIIAMIAFIHDLFLPNIVRHNLRKTINTMYTQGKNDSIGLHKYTISP